MSNPVFVDTHAHLDGPEFTGDLPQVIARARQAGVGAVLLPGVDWNSVSSVMQVCRDYEDYCYPMIGLQPEEVNSDWSSVLDSMQQALDHNLHDSTLPQCLRYIAIGECGLDFYWSRQFENEQLKAFERQVQWSVKTQLPLMIHCRKAQNELIAILRHYEHDLPGGVFHCFTGNRKEAEAYLRFDKFCLGVGGVSTFKSSRLREDLPAAVPPHRLVIETDSPYMAPVPHRGQRNESAFAAEVLRNLATCYDMPVEELARTTNDNVKRLFGITPRNL